MIEIGRICIKTAGRDATKHAVVVDIIDNGLVLIDGNVRRRKVSLTHLEPLNKTIPIEKGADTKEILEKLKELGIKITKKSGEEQSNTKKE